MRYLFPILIVCAGLFFTACSDDDDLNTGKAVVAMKQQTMDVKENKTFYVPVNVTGEQNGPIVVTVNVTSNNTSYKKDKDFIVTSETVTIPSSKQEVSVEISLTDDRVINEEDRILNVRITEVKGADIDASAASCLVNIVDNDNTPYDRMISNWTVSITEGFSGSPMIWEASLTGYDDANENYGKELLMQPLYDAYGSAIALESGYVAMPIKFKSISVGGTERAELKIDCGTVIAEGVNFDASGENPNLQDCRLRIVSLGVAGIVTSGQITGVVNDTFDTIEFNMPILCEILTKTNQNYGYMFYYDSMKMTMK